MKANSITYLITVFFATLFLFKGASSVLPALFAGIGNIAMIEKLIHTETGEESKHTGEKFEQEHKEIYLDTFHRVDIPAIEFSATKNNIHTIEILYQQSVPSIPTPPPELS